MPDDHSKVEPLLPIPNRTVKRFCADDSEQLACESRLSSGFYTKNPNRKVRVFFWPYRADRSGGVWTVRSTLLDEDGAQPWDLAGRAWRRELG